VAWKLANGFFSTCYSFTGLLSQNLH
jgi:hypothetical protein